MYAYFGRSLLIDRAIMERQIFLQEDSIYLTEINLNHMNDIPLVKHAYLSLIEAILIRLEFVVLRSDLHS